MTNLQHKGVIQRLEKAGIRPSVQRVAIADYLSEHRTHPTVDEIYMALKDDYPTLSRTTVYNTVWLLADSGVITAINIDRANSRFDYEISSHAHFRCKKCGRVIDLEMPEVKSSTPQGLKIDNVSVYYDGLCPACQTQEATEK